MVLNISGIDKLVGEQFRTRTIQKVTNAKRYGEKSDAYVFQFAPILTNVLTNPNRYKQWEDGFEVYLSRYPDPNGIYELFWMGLHGVTCQQLDKRDIMDFDTFTGHLGLVVERGRNYWRNL
jgi:hypothetical protein